MASPARNATELELRSRSLNVPGKPIHPSLPTVKRRSYVWEVGTAEGPTPLRGKATRGPTSATGPGERAWSPSFQLQEVVLRFHDTFWRAEQVGTDKGDVGTATASPSSAGWTPALGEDHPRLPTLSKPRRRSQSPPAASPTPAPPRRTPPNPALDQ